MIINDIVFLSGCLSVIFMDINSFVFFIWSQSLWSLTGLSSCFWRRFWSIWLEIDLGSHIPLWVISIGLACSSPKGMWSISTNWTWGIMNIPLHCPSNTKSEMVKWLSHKSGQCTVPKHKHKVYRVKCLRIECVLFKYW